MLQRRLVAIEMTLDRTEVLSVRFLYIVLLETHNKYAPEESYDIPIPRAYPCKPSGSPVLAEQEHGGISTEEIKRKSPFKPNKKTKKSDARLLSSLKKKFRKWW